MRAPGSLDSATRGELAVRRLKVALLRARRLAAWAADPAAWRRPALACAEDGFPYPIYEAAVAIGRTDPGADPRFEDGKRTNLALAAPAFDGLILSPAAPLSFWRVLGRPTSARGFRPGMELRAGCIVPAIGGGLCLLSNALFRLACELGWTVIERHGHTVEAAPAGPGVWGIDATVLWPFVDLRVAPRAGEARLAVRVAGDALHLAVRAGAPHELRAALSSEDDRVEAGAGGSFRSNRLRRRLTDRHGRVVDDAIIGDNRKRVLDVAAQRRNCYTCEADCHARPADLVPPPPRPGA